MGIWESLNSHLPSMKILDSLLVWTPISWVGLSTFSTRSGLIWLEDSHWRCLKTGFSPPEQDEKHTWTPFPLSSVLVSDPYSHNGSITNTNQEVDRKGRTRQWKSLTWLSNQETQDWKTNHYYPQVPVSAITEPTRSRILDRKLLHYSFHNPLRNKIFRTSKEHYYKYMVWAKTCPTQTKKQEIHSAILPSPHFIRVPHLVAAYSAMSTDPQTQQTKAQIARSDSGSLEASSFPLPLPDQTKANQSSSPSDGTGPWNDSAANGWVPFGCSPTLLWPSYCHLCTLGSPTAPREGWPVTFMRGLDPPRCRSRDPTIWSTGRFYPDLASAICSWRWSKKAPLVGQEPKDAYPDPPQQPDFHRPDHFPSLPPRSLERLPFPHFHQTHPTEPPADPEFCDQSQFRPSRSARFEWWSQNPRYRSQDD